MLTSLRSLSQENQEDLIDDARNILRSHGDIILEADSRLDLFLKVMVPTRRGEPYVALPLPMPFITHSRTDNVVDLKFLWFAGTNTFPINGVIDDVDTPSLTTDSDADWALDESVCFFSNSSNVRDYANTSSARLLEKKRLLDEGYSEEGAERLSYESNKIAWYDELVFVWFTTTTENGNYGWRNGVLHLKIALSDEEKALRIGAWRDGLVRDNMPNNSKLPQWRSVGRLERAECVFNMPHASVSAFKIARARALLGKRARE